MANKSLEDTTAKDFILESSISHLLHRAQQLAAMKSASALREAGVTLRQFSVLAAATGESEPSQSRLVELTGIDRSTLADMLNRMEQSNLIVRTQSKTDARAKSVSLTSQGARALELAGPAVANADAELIGLLAKNRRSSFIDLLGTLIGNREASESKSKSDGDTATKSKSKSKSKPKDKTKTKAKTSGKKKKKKKEKS